MFREKISKGGGGIEGHLVGGREFGPGLVRPAVVVLSLGALYVLVEAQDLSGLQLSHGGPLGQLRDTNTSKVRIKTRALETG